MIRLQICQKIFNGVEWKDTQVESRSLSSTYQCSLWNLGATCAIEIMQYHHLVPNVIKQIRCNAPTSAPANYPFIMNRLFSVTGLHSLTTINSCNAYIIPYKSMYQHATSVWNISIQRNLLHLPKWCQFITPQKTKTIEMFCLGKNILQKAKTAHDANTQRMQNHTTQINLKTNSEKILHIQFWKYDCNRLNHAKMITFDD